MLKFVPLSVTAGLLLGTIGLSSLQAQTKPPATAAKPSTSSTAGTQKKPKSKLETLTKDMTKVEGLFTLYHNDQKLLAVIKSSDFGKNFIVLVSIARGISSGNVLGGMSWGFENDAVWSFRKVGEKIHVLRRNVRFKAQPGSPEANASSAS